MSTITIRRGGSFDTPAIIELSLDGGRLLPSIEEALLPLLQYTHLYQLRGADAWDHATGEYRPTRVEIRKLYLFDDHGRLCCPDGFRYRLKRTLEGLGHSVAEVYLGPVHPRRDRYEVNWDNIFDHMDLKDKQVEWLASMEANEQGLVEAPPGAGKTYTIAAYCLSHPKARIHIITSGVDILQRIYASLVNYLPSVGMVGGGKNHWGRVTCLSADSLHKVGEGFDIPNAAQSPDVVIFDEVHLAAAPTTLEQLSKYKNCRRYGFSGSLTGRFDGAEKQLEGLFGELIFSMTYQEAEALGMVVPIRVEWIRVKTDKDPVQGLINPTAKERHGIWTHEHRNRLIAEKAREFEDGTQILILVSKVEHAVHLKQYLPEFRLCYSAGSGSEGTGKSRADYVRARLLDPADEPPMTSQRRNEMRKAFEAGALKRVIATDVWGTGVDFPLLQVLIRADGRSSDILDTQLPGRATRISEGKEYGLLVDCMDEWNDTYLRRSNSRKRNYIKKGWTMVGLGKRRLGTATYSQNRV